MPSPSRITTSRFSPTVGPLLMNTETEIALHFPHRRWSSGLRCHVVWYVAYQRFARTCCHRLLGHNLNLYRRENIKSYISLSMLTTLRFILLTTSLQGAGCSLRCHSADSWGTEPITVTRVHRWTPSCVHTILL